MVSVACLLHARTVLMIKLLLHYLLVPVCSSSSPAFCIMPALLASDTLTTLAAVCFCTPAAACHLQELSRTAAAAGLPGAESWTSPGEWAPTWAAITKVRLL